MIFSIRPTVPRDQTMIRFGSALYVCVCVGHPSIKLIAPTITNGQFDFRDWEPISLSLSEIESSGAEKRNTVCDMVASISSGGSIPEQS